FVSERVKLALDVERAINIWRADRQAAPEVIRDCFDPCLHRRERHRDRGLAVDNSVLSEQDDLARGVRACRVHAGQLFLTRGKESRRPTPPRPRRTAIAASL